MSSPAGTYRNPFPPQRHIIDGLASHVDPTIKLMPYVYMLRCADGSYYVGSTRNLERRFAEHASGVGAMYTRARLPVEIVFAQYFDRVDEAYEREKQIQGWSRKKREALLDGR